MMVHGLINHDAELEHRVIEDQLIVKEDEDADATVGPWRLLTHMLGLDRRLMDGNVSPRKI